RRAPQRRAVAQLQRRVLDRRVRGRAGRGLRLLHAPVGATGPGDAGGGSRLSAPYSVMSRKRVARSAALESAAAGLDCSIISLAMSPSTRTLPAMKACMPACGFPSIKIAFAVT